MRKQNITNRELLILAMWFMEQKVFIFRCKTDIRDEPAQPGPAKTLLTACFSNLLKDMSLKLSHNIDTGLKIAVTNFHRDFLLSFEVIAFFAKTDFCHFHVHLCV